MDELIKHIYNIIEMDRATLGVIGGLCLMSAYALKDYMANPVLIIFVYPVLFLFSVLIQYGIISLELYPPRKLDQWLMWTIMASICGNILAIAFVAGVGRFVDGSAPGRRTQTQPDRR
jgi:hypothetical protein